MQTQPKKYGTILKKCYAVPNIPCIHQLKAKIASCKQNYHEVVDFFSKLMGLWTELDNYVQIPKCKCDVVKKIAKMKKRRKFINF